MSSMNEVPPHPETLWAIGALLPSDEDEERAYRVWRETQMPVSFVPYWCAGEQGLAVPVYSADAGDVGPLRRLGYLEKGHNTGVFIIDPYAREYSNE